MSTLLHWLQAHALRTPKKPAIMLMDRVVTFEMLLAGVNSVQSVIGELKLDPGKPVGVMVENAARHIIVGLALMKSGFAFASLRPNLIEPAARVGMTQLIVDTALPFDARLRAFFVDETWFSKSAVKHVSSIAQPPERVARISFTSGSTGEPKAISYTHKVLQDRVFKLFLAGVGSHERVMSAYGVSGPGFIQALQTMCGGRTICFAQQDDLLGLMTYLGVDEVRGSVIQLRALLLDQVAQDRPVALKLISAGGAYLPYALAEEFRTAFRCEVINPYSSVEAGPIGMAGGSLMRLRPTRGNCFSPLAQVEIVTEAGDALPAGEEGVIRVRSDSVCRPFTGALIEEGGAPGWAYPGDLGRIDPDGLLVVTGRADEVINDGGSKFSPELLEEAVRGHPGIADLAALSMRGADGIEEGWLVAKPKGDLTLASVNAWLAKSAPGEMSNFRFRRLEIVDEIPRTGAGKVARGALRARLRGDA